jgi:hypothetical protein
MFSMEYFIIAVFCKSMFEKFLAIKKVKKAPKGIACQYTKQQR